MNPHARLEYVDVFRGFALLTMVVWHVFNVLAVADIYTDAPYFIAAFSMPTPFPPPLLFAFVSGMSVFLLCKKLTEGKRGNLKRRIFKRYMKYVLVSLPFTAVVFSPLTYLRWEEALQGIGLTAIFAALILLYVRPGVRGLTALILGAAALEALLLSWVSSTPALNPYPLSPSLEPTSLVGSVLFNAFVGGWFSVANLLPMMLGGALMLRLLQESRSRAAFHTSTLFIAAAVVLHAAGMPISYYGRTFAFALFSVGQPMLILYVLYALYARVPRFLSFMRVLGRESLLVYLGHFVLVVKPLELSGLVLPDVAAALLTIPLVGLVYGGTRLYALRVNNRRVPVEQEKMAV